LAGSDDATVFCEPCSPNDKSDFTKAFLKTLNFGGSKDDPTLWFVVLDTGGVNPEWIDLQVLRPILEKGAAELGTDFDFDVWAVKGVLGKKPKQAKRLYFDVIPKSVDDYVAYRDGRIKNRLAKKFCECCLKDSIQKGSQETTDEGFVYSTGLDDCYGKEFKKYGKGMTDKQREAFIEDVEEIIFKKCPASVEKVFDSAPEFDR
jgi:hypothetical protein